MVPSTGPPQRLSSLAGIAGDVGGRGKQVREHRSGDPVANGRRKVGHLTRIGDQPTVVLVCKLLGPKRRQPQLRDGRRSARRVEIGQVPRRPTRTRLIEHQLGDHDLSSIAVVRAAV